MKMEMQNGFLGNLLIHGVYWNSSQKRAMVSFFSFALLTFQAPLRPGIMQNQGYVQTITGSISGAKH
jgi:hypothetical protein